VSAGTRSRAALAIGIAACVFAAFAPALTAGFSWWDDDKNFLETYGWRGLSVEHLRWMATTFHGGPYQPLSWLSLALQHAVWGMSPAAFHAGNVALHAATALAFFLLARRWLPPAGAAAAALLFALHPLRVESVAWITERRDVLSGLFYVLAVLAYLSAAEEADGPRRRRLLAAALLAFLLGLLAKASGMTLPLVMLLLDRRPLRESWKGMVPFAALSIAFAAVALAGQASVPHTLSTMGEHGVLERIAQAAYAAVFYPAKTLLPIRLSPIYERPVPLDPFALRFAAATVVAGGATAVLFAMRRSMPAAWKAWAAFLVILAPVSGLVQVGPQLVADRYSYLACMPFALLAAGALFARWPKAAPAVSLAAIAVLGVATWRQTALWRDTEALFRRALEIEPDNRIAHDVVGRMLAMRGKPEEAAQHYRRSIELAPAYPIPHNNLGLLLLQQGRADEAIAEFESALRADDDYARARTNLGAALVKKGSLAEAESVLRDAVRRDSRDAGARTNLGQVLVREGRFEAAVRELEIALASNPGLAEAHEGLSQAFTGLGRADLAEEHRRQAQVLRKSGEPR
jgi:Tfp pilus assembly protein PilF